VSARRYYLEKRYEAFLSGNDGLYWATRYNQKAIAATALPAGFTALAKLHFPPAFCVPTEEQVSGNEWFTTYEDLENLTADQLNYIGLTPDESAAVAAAVTEHFAS